MEQRVLKLIAHVFRVMAFALTHYGPPVAILLNGIADTLD
jgi:hypothetical protein